jgi:hypothetical protein
MSVIPTTGVSKTARSGIHFCILGWNPWATTRLKAISLGLISLLPYLPLIFADMASCPRALPYCVINLACTAIQGCAFKCRSTKVFSKMPAILCGCRPPLVSSADGLSAALAEVYPASGKQYWTRASKVAGNLKAGPSQRVSHF